MSEQAKITCGDDCGHCKPARDGWYHIAPCGTPEPKIGLRRTTVLVTMLPVKHCPLTGRALGFDADGNPTVGPCPEVQADDMAALSAQWREEAREYRNLNRTGGVFPVEEIKVIDQARAVTFERCADELDAALKGEW